MPAMVRDAAYATFINTFRCAPENQDEVVKINLDILDQVVTKFPGFISATVHRSTDGTQVINYLQWETPNHLAAMQSSDAFKAVAGRMAGLVEFDPHQCEVVDFRENPQT